jgi:hypothetical protein
MIHVISMRKEGEKDAAVLSKVHHLAIQNKKAMRQTHTSKIISNFRFKSRLRTHEVVSGVKKITLRLFMMLARWGYSWCGAPLISLCVQN